jgi:hypothetical protein
MKKIIKSLSLAFALTATIASSSFAESKAFDNFVSPVSNPVNFEDPRTLTEIRPIYIYHKIDDNFVTGGGQAQIFALQARAALTDRLSLIATKDGYVHLQPDSVLNDDKGFANIAAGLKYAFYQDPTNGVIASAGFRYEAPSGEKEVLQGNGDGVFNPFSSVAFSLCKWNFMAGTGFRVPANHNDSTFYDFDAHVDYDFGWFRPLFELNLTNVIDPGRRLPIADEGQDFFNIGSSLSRHKTMLTGAAGARFILSDRVTSGVAYQFPIAQGAGTYITDWRLTTDLTVSF